MAEVARRSGMDNATAFRFLNTLVDIGYVDRSKEFPRRPRLEFEDVCRIV